MTKEGWEVRRLNGKDIPWNKGLTKETDERVVKYSVSISKTTTGRHYSPNTEFKKDVMPWNKGLIKEIDDRVANHKIEKDIGSEYINQGRTYIKTPEGWMLRSRFIKEQELGRKLESLELIHHKDENPMNDEPPNLSEPMTRAEHMNLHNNFHNPNPQAVATKSTIIQI